MLGFLCAIFNFWISFHVKKAATEREAFIAVKAQSGDLALDPPVVSVPAPHTTDRSVGNSVLERATTDNLPHDVVLLSPGSQDVDTKANVELGLPNNTDIIRLEQAATKAQAAFRGYLVIFSCIKYWKLHGLSLLRELLSLLFIYVLATCICCHIIWHINQSLNIFINHVYQSCLLQEFLILHSGTSVIYMLWMLPNGLFARKRHGVGAVWYICMCKDLFAPIVRLMGIDIDLFAPLNIYFV